MISFTLPLLTALAASVLALPPGPGKPPTPAPAGCGEVDVIFTGLPPYHPLVIEQGFDPAIVDSLLRTDAAEVVAAGYNLRVVLFGPDQPLSVLEDRMKGIQWHATGVGAGVRASVVPDLTVHLENILQVYRDISPQGKMLFNYSPDTVDWALERRFPLSENCTEAGKPGTDLGFEIYCDIC